MADRCLFIYPDGFIDEVDPDGQLRPRYPAMPELWADLDGAGYPRLTDTASAAVCIKLTVSDDGVVTAHTVDAPTGHPVGSVTRALAAWLAANSPLHSRLTTSTDRSVPATDGPDDVPKPWTNYCPGCGHLMLLHDVEDMDGSNPSCCVEGCEQRCGNTAPNPSGGDL